MVRLYFGKGGGVKPTKQEVGSFIKNEMGFVRKGDQPEWSSGICQLVAMGMDAWRHGQVDRAHLISPERVESLEERNKTLNEEVRQLRAELSRTNREREGIDAVRKVQEIEASILKVLCSSENIGAKSPNYVDVEELAHRTGYDYDTIMHYAETLSQAAFGGHTNISRMETQVKATSATAYDDYCEAARIDGVTLDE